MIRKNKKAIHLVITALLFITLVSCDPGKKYEKEERSLIESFLKQNADKNFELKPSGLYYLEVLTGTGIMPRTHDTAYIKYTGMTINGYVFESNILNGRTDTLKIPVNEGWLIQGEDEGISYMRAGGKAVFLIPSSLGFGPTGSYPYISGYMPVLYDVQLVKVKLGPVIKLIVE